MEQSNDQLNPEIAIIGGTGLADLPGFILENAREIETPFGKPSSSILSGTLNGTSVCFLARHGNPHKLLPHQINYRANIWSLHSLGIKKIVAVNAVGGIAGGMHAAHINIPHQIIDYTHKRESSYCQDEKGSLLHIDFSYPFDEDLREKIISNANGLSLDVSDSGVYACTEGPRLETEAEINRLEKDGCDIVGMTAMPEAALAREKYIAYASICLVVNKAAGRSDGLITMKEINETLEIGMGRVMKLLCSVITDL